LGGGSADTAKATLPHPTTSLGAAASRRLADYLAFASQGARPAVDTACTILKPQGAWPAIGLRTAAPNRTLQRMTTPSTNAVRAVAELERDRGSDAELEATIQLPADAALTVDGVELAGWTGGCASVLHPKTPSVVVRCTVLAVYKATGATFELATLSYPEDGVVVYGKVSELLEHALPPAA
jgi:hypothetical protein